MMNILTNTLNRRMLLGAVCGLAMGRSANAADDEVGEAANVRGKVAARRSGKVMNLAAGAGVRLKDSVQTSSKSFAQLDFTGGTTVHMGSKARLVIDQFVANAGGVLQLGEGALVFDRAESLPKIDLTVRSRFGQIAVRGTRFFAGPSKGVFGVFVERGAVEVTAAGVSRRLEAGDGVDIKAPGQPPGEVKKWGKARIDAALASVGL
jgi:ferric-dicitrate binding protein FerR (iron transport regulator)